MNGNGRRDRKVKARINRDRGGHARNHRGKSANGSQGDFITDHTRPSGEIDKRKDIFHTQYQKYEDSGNCTISGREGGDTQFPKDLEKNS